MSETRRFTMLIDSTEKGDFIVSVRNVKTDEEKSWILPAGKVQLFTAFGGVAGEAAKFLFGEVGFAVERGISELQAAMARQRAKSILNNRIAPTE